jgi:hypothetical protein
MRLAIITAALTALAPAARAVDLGPLAPAAQGKVQCFSPNTAARTCQSIGAYRITPAGAIENEAIVMVSTSPLVVMTTVAPVQIKAGADCGVMLAKYLTSATFTVDGRPLDAAQTAKLRAAFTEAMRATLGHEICVSYRPQGEGVLATSTLDGTPRPEMDQKVLWVSPADGWRVGF